MKHIKTKIIAGLLAFSCLAMNACTIVYEQEETEGESAASGTGGTTSEEDLRIPTEFPTRDVLDSVITKCGSADVKGEELYFYYYQLAQLVAEQNRDYIPYYGGALPDYAYSLKSQFIMTDTTWYDYLNKSIDSYLEYMYTLSEAAKAEGITLTDDELAKAEKKASEYKLPDAVTYISADTVKECIAREALSEKYDKHLREVTKATDDEITAEYDKNRILYDMVDMRLIAIEYKADDTVTDAENASYLLPTKAEANDIGAQLSACTTPEEFDKIAEDFFKKYFPDITKDNIEYYVSSSAYKNFKYTENYKDYEIVKWAMDPARVEGEKNLIDSESDHTLYFALIEKPARPDDSKTVSVRHILIEKEEDAKKILDEYNASDKTEDTFAALANKYTIDPGSSTNGGLYENFSEGTMVAEFNDWSFDEKRLPGDVDIVKTTHGYHIIYFVSEGLPGYVMSVKSTIEGEKFNKLYEEKQKAYPIKISEEVIEGLKV